MRVLLFRHGIAHDRADPHCPPDPERALVEEGIKKTRKSARGLLSLGCKPTRLLTSPYVRARQTADIVGEVLGLPSDAFVTTSALLPETPPYTLFHALYAFDGEDEEVICVGHAPNLDEVIALCLTGQRDPLGQLKKSGAALLEINKLPKPNGHLLWMIPPKALGGL